MEKRGRRTLAAEDLVSMFALFMHFPKILRRVREDGCERYLASSESHPWVSETAIRELSASLLTARAPFLPLLTGRTVHS
jgi:hypothetical protein